MMAVMDTCPALRWCLDIDTLTADSQLAKWLVWMDRLVDPLAVVGWFSITDPAPLRTALAPLPGITRAICYVVGAEIPGWSCSTMGEFEERLASTFRKSCAPLSQ